MDNTDTTNTRRRILTTLKRNGEATAADLALALFVTVSAIRQHLTRLSAESLIRYREVGSGPGRRRRLYSLTPAAESHFPQAYESLALRLAAFVEAKAPDVLDAFLREDAAARLPVAGAEGQPLPLPAVAAMLSRTDFLAETVTAGGHEEVTVYHCPVVAFAHEHPACCALEQETIAALVQSAVERTSWRLEGAPFCRYRIAAPPEGMA